MSAHPVEVLVAFGLNLRWETTQLMAIGTRRDIAGLPLAWRGERECVPWEK